jgi:hypothetical protein
MQERTLTIGPALSAFIERLMCGNFCDNVTLQLIKRNPVPMPLLKTDEIAWNEKLRRCIYFFLRHELEKILLEEALVRSYQDFEAAQKEYPFVEMRELKPRARIVAPEHPEQKRFIVIFNEEHLPSEAKNYIRFFDSNKVTKENVTNLIEFDLEDLFHQRTRYFEDKHFASLLRTLLSTDFAVLIQRDPSVKARYRFGLSHFHVRIDWPVADAAEDLGRNLRYISKSLYEKGDRVGEILQQKLYEHYGFHYMVGGRRTAALVAAQFMTRFDFLSTVYLASTEARTFIVLGAGRSSKYVLVKIPNQDIKELAHEAGLNEKEFAAAYLIDNKPDHGVGIFLVTYCHTESSTPPLDGKLRDVNPDLHWLTVDLQLLIPPPWSQDARPLPYSIVYA